MYELPSNIPPIYQDLEWFTDLDTTSNSQRNAIWKSLSQVFKALYNELFGGTDIRVWEYVDRVGDTWWMIQDSLADEPFRSLSINDTRVWLEQQYLASSDDF